MMRAGARGSDRRLLHADGGPTRDRFLMQFTAENLTGMDLSVSEVAESSAWGARGYFAYYHEWRPHRSLEMDSPDGRPVHPPEQGEIIEFPTAHGLHHYYLRSAA